MSGNARSGEKSTETNRKVRAVLLDTPQLSQMQPRYPFSQFLQNFRFRFLHLCREGYLRLSSAEYTPESLADDFVHLTNQAIQKNSPEYGTKEDGN